MYYPYSIVVGDGGSKASDGGCDLVQSVFAFHSVPRRWISNVTRQAAVVLLPKEEETNTTPEKYRKCRAHPL